jgi:hypothetical protein
MSTRSMTRKADRAQPFVDALVLTMRFSSLHRCDQITFPGVLSPLFSAK